MNGMQRRLPTPPSAQPAAVTGGEDDEDDESDTDDQADTDEPTAGVHVPGAGRARCPG